MPLLVEVALSLAGCPAQILGPYRDMMRGVMAVNMLPHGAGEPYKKRCSIPQGCPFGMMITALLLRPWISASRSAITIPRTLADDLLLIASAEADTEEESLLDVFTAGMQYTIEFVTDMGGPISFPNASSWPRGRATEVLYGDARGAMSTAFRSGIT